MFMSWIQILFLRNVHVLDPDIVLSVNPGSGSAFKMEWILSTAFDLFWSAQWIIYFIHNGLFSKVKIKVFQIAGEKIISRYYNYWQRVIFMKLCTYMQAMGAESLNITCGAVCVYPSRVPECVQFLQKYNASHVSSDI